MVIFGIDPGVSGSIVAIDEEGRLIDHMIMPTIMIGKKNRVSGSEIAGFIRQHYWDGAKAVIEQVGAMPGQGVSSMFSFGHSAGIVEGVVQAMGMQYITVTPQAWKKTAGLIGKDKDAARSQCLRMYPDEKVLHLKGKGQAVADAILIARHGMKIL